MAMPCALASSCSLVAMTTAWVGEDVPCGEDACECGGFAVSGWHADDEVCVACFQRRCDALEEIEDVWRGFEVGFDELRELQWRHR
jgi:hypothetical protein